MYLAGTLSLFTGEKALDPSKGPNLQGRAPRPWLIPSVAVRRLDGRSIECARFRDEEVRVERRGLWVLVRRRFEKMSSGTLVIA